LIKTRDVAAFDITPHVVHLVPKRLRVVRHGLVEGGHRRRSERRV